MLFQHITNQSINHTQPQYPGKRGYLYTKWSVSTSIP